jgi:antitoxin HigA-1
VLLEEYLTPLGITTVAFAKRLGITSARLASILRGKRGIVAEDALRLARVLGTSADFWLGLQLGWDIWHAMKGASGPAIAKLRPLTRKKGRGSLMARAKKAERQLEGAARARVRPLVAKSEDVGRLLLKRLKQAAAIRTR